MPALALDLHDVDQDLSTAVASFLDACVLRNLSPKTVEWYRYCLGPFVAYAAERGTPAPTAVTADVIRGFLTGRASQVGPRRLNHYREAIRLFFNWAVAEGHAASNPAVRIAKVREGRKLIPTFTERELRLLLRQPDPTTFLGLRDYTFMLLLIDTGLRLAEALGLHIDDIDQAEGAAKVTGKGNRERLVGFSRAFARELTRYLRARDTTVRRAGRPDCTWLFPNQEGGRWASKGAQMRLSRYGEEAGITRVRVSPHVFRHTFSLWFVRSGGSPFHLQRILGHSSLAMSRRYCELADLDAVSKQGELSPLMTMELTPARGRLR